MSQPRIKIIDRTSKSPLWAQVQADIMRRLRRGEFTAENLTEHTLAQEYGVSRHTVREALRDLRGAGIIQAQRGRSPRVGVLNQVMGNLYSLFRSVEGQGMKQRSAIIHQELCVNSVVATILDIPIESDLVYIERVRYAEDIPLAHDQVWLPASKTRAILNADLRHAALYDELEKLCGIRFTEANEVITAIIADSHQQRLLDLQDEKACFRIERVSMVGDVILERRLTTLAGNRFRLTSKLQ